MEPSAIGAYEALAPYYDRYTGGEEYVRKLARVAALIDEYDPPGHRLLDVACGTGNSTQAMQACGFDARGCDSSPAMVGIARAKMGDPERVVVADMLSLPPLGPVDVVTCLGDSLNYILELADLDAALASIASQLVAGGLLVFDLSTLLLYRTWYAADSERAAGDVMFRWCGSGAVDALPNSLHRATIEVLEPAADGTMVRHLSNQVQRHWPWAIVAAALGRAAYELVAIRGQRSGATLEGWADEAHHHKLLVVCRASHAQGTGSAHREETPCSGSRNRRTEGSSPGGHAPPVRDASHRPERSHLVRVSEHLGSA